ncbi:MAG: PEP-CTERM sorting domain-containing protein [Terriglobales bacterium]
MVRAFGSMIAGSLLLLSMAAPVAATPVFSRPTVALHSLSANVGDLFNSALNAHAVGNNGHEIASRQFSARVPVAETPEPSTLALFGTGLLMVAGAVRRKFSR